jgi:heterodisulfide reductase subunit C
MEHGSDVAAGTVAALLARVGVAPARCYQCGRCAAGCPQNVAGEMDLSPTRVMRLLQLEAAFAGDAAAGAHAQRALSAETPWLCVGCLACTSGCPQGLDVAAAMDVLRQEGLRRGVASRTARARKAQALHRTFLDHALRRGRVHELSFVMAYKLRSGDLLADASLAPRLLRRGKLRLTRPYAPATTRVRAALAAIRRDGAAEGRE